MYRTNTTSNPCGERSLEAKMEPFQRFSVLHQCSTSELDSCIPSITVATFCGRPSASCTSFWREVASAALLKTMAVARGYTGAVLWYSSDVNFPVLNIDYDLSKERTVSFQDHCPASVWNFVFILYNGRKGFLVCSTWLCHGTSSVVETIPAVLKLFCAPLNTWWAFSPTCYAFSRSLVTSSGPCLAVDKLKNSYLSVKQFFQPSIRLYYGCYRLLVCEFPCRQYASRHDDWIVTSLETCLLKTWFEWRQRGTCLLKTWFKDMVF